MRILLFSALIFCFNSLYSQDWGSYDALRGQDNWVEKRKAKERQMQMMEQQSRKTKFYYGITCGAMATKVVKDRELKAVVDHSELSSDWLYKVSIYKTIYVDYEVIAYMYSSNGSDIHGYIYCHVSAANWNAFVDTDNTSILSVNQRFRKYIHDVDKYKCMCD